MQRLCSDPAAAKCITSENQRSQFLWNRIDMWTSEAWQHYIRLQHCMVERAVTGKHNQFFLSGSLLRDSINGESSCNDFTRRQPNGNSQKMIWYFHMSTPWSFEHDNRITEPFFLEIPFDVAAIFVMSQAINSIDAGAGRCWRSKVISNTIIRAHFHLAADWRQEGWAKLNPEGVFVSLGDIKGERSQVASLCGA